MRVTTFSMYRMVWYSHDSSVEPLADACCYHPGINGQASNGLLPQPPDATASARGIASQPQLAHLLRYVLCNTHEGVDTARRWTCCPSCLHQGH